jgi:hypothetical protein
MTRWCAWRRIFPCACRWSTARATSARSTAIRRRPCVIPNRACQGRRLLLDDLDKDTVDFRTTTTAPTQEPSVLPAKFPNLLVNGAGGIAVGMATNIPPHNLGEVIDACMAISTIPTSRIDEL